MRPPLACLLLLAIVGCDRPQEPMPFRPGGLTTAEDPGTLGRRPAPTLKITRPGGSTDYFPGDPIACEVEVTVPEGGKLPTGLVFELRKGSTICTSAGAEPKQRLPSGRYLFAGRLACPKRPGRYTLVANSWDMTRPSRGAGGRTSYVLSPAVEVRVEAKR